MSSLIENFVYKKECEKVRRKSGKLIHQLLHNEEDIAIPWWQQLEQR